MYALSKEKHLINTDLMEIYYYENRRWIDRWIDRWIEKRERNIERAREREGVEM